MAAVKLAIRLPLLIAVLAGILFGCAGRLDLPFFWGWLAVPVVAVLAAVRRVDPGLLQERMHPGPGGADRHLGIVVLPFWAAHIAVAGLDVGRFHWTDHVPLVLQAGGLFVFAATYALAIWAVTVNRFYSPVVRIQSERGHVLVTGGPYRWVRHPGYAGVLVGMPCGGLALGSWWSLAPLAPVVVLLFRRALIEDRYVHQHLAGYPEYAQRVRHRMLPGLW